MRFCVFPLAIGFFLMLLLSLDWIFPVSVAEQTYVDHNRGPSKGTLISESVTALLKNAIVYMRNNRSFFYPLFIFLLVCLAAFYIHDLYFAQSRSVTVVGVGKKKVKPEKATVSFSVVQESIDQQEAIREGERKYNALLQGVAEFNPTAVDKTAYQVLQRSQTAAGSLQSTNLYQYVNAARIEVNDPIVMQSIVSSLYERGATVVSQVRFIPEDQEKIDREVRELAIKDARNRVSQIARASGARVGNVITVQEAGSTGETGTSVTGQVQAGSVDTLGEIEIQAVVTVVFELK